MYKFAFLISVLLIVAPLNVYAYGPFDYTNPTHYREKLPVVEKYHFNKDVETLKNGMDGKSVGDDLSYVLRTFPNHHRALNSMMRLWRRYQQKNAIPPGLTRDKTPDYWYKRAISFSPHDGVVKMLYGIYLHSEGKLDQALVLYKEAEVNLPAAFLSELHYDMGLLFIKMKKYRDAALQAHKAYVLGYPLPGLREKLKAVGAWPKYTAH